MRGSSEKALWLTSTVVCLTILAALSFLPLAAGIWLPDVFLARPRILASHDATNGYRFRVIQYWNHVDFYSTELHVISPDGKTDVRTLDGDDLKRWSVPMTVDESSRVVSIKLGRGQTTRDSW